MKIAIRLALIPQPLLPKWEKGGRTDSKSLSQSGRGTLSEGINRMFYELDYSY